MSGDLLTANVNASFEDILGKTGETFKVAVRRARWAAYIRAARNHKGASAALKNGWLNKNLLAETSCLTCAYRRGYWCTYAGLPCSVNPILSFRYGLSGMACMGAVPKQPKKRKAKARAE